MKHIFITILLLFTVYQLQAQIVTIPDINFKNALIDNVPLIDSNNDGEIQVSEAEAADEIYISYEGILDLTGLEAFINLEILRIYSNSIPSINLSSNTALINLIIGGAQITDLDLSFNTSILTLELGGNQISDLDLSNNLELNDIYIINNPLINLNLGNNTSLEILEVSSNVILTTLDVSNNTSLKKIELVNNGMTSLNVTNNTNLEILRTYGNNLTELDISNNTMLKELNTMFNQLSHLDLSNNPNLEWFNARNNQLETLDARNGNNDLFVNFNVLDNAELECILVDDPTAIYLSSWHVDENTLFGSNNQNCQLLSVNENGLNTQNMYPNPVKNILHIEMTSSIKQVTIYNINGQQIKQEYLKTPTSQHEINLGYLKTGIYYIKVRTKSSEQIEKIVKM